MKTKHKQKTSKFKAAKLLRSRRILAIPLIIFIAALGTYLAWNLRSRASIPPPIAYFFVPHQDDETLSMGPAIEKAVSEGKEVRIVLLANGAGSFVRNLYCNKGSSLCDPGNFSEARMREFRAALARLGVSPNKITYERIQDNQVTTARAMDVIRRYINTPNATFNTTSWLDGHSDHGSTGLALDELCRGKFRAGTCVFHTQHYLETSTPPNIHTFYGDFVGTAKTSQAAAEYRYVDEANGRYGIGYQSVKGYFDALDHNGYKARWHYARNFKHITPADFNGDGKADIAVFRPSNGSWYIKDQQTKKFGAKTDIPIGNYGSAGKVEPMVFKLATSQWLLSSTGEKVQHGAAGDILVPGDYNGDKTTDLAVFRPSNGTWYINSYSEKQTVVFGTRGDIPVPADYTGDGKTDIAVYRPSNNRWYVYMRSTVVQFGTQGDIPVPGDYNGDGSAEVALFRPSTGRWYVHGRSASTHFGYTGDVPVQADYDGDGKTDIAVYRPSNNRWYINGQPSVVYGTAGDIPLTVSPGIYAHFFKK